MALKSTKGYTPGSEEHEAKRTAERTSAKSGTTRKMQAKLGEVTITLAL